MKNEFLISPLRQNLDDWKDFFNDRGLEESLINDYISYIKPLLRNNVPVIFEIQHLSLLIGVPVIELKKMIFSPNHFYRTFEIPKKSGGSRQITTPYPSLKRCQKWIYNNILKKNRVHQNAHGYVLSKSILSNAATHVNQKNIIKIDIKDFFPSLKINWVVNYFKRLGYSHDISFYLSSLCCLNNSLPQGAVTSPYLSNILTLSLDRKLSKYAENHGLNYSRYADDIFLSGNFVPLDCFSEVKKIIKGYGFNINNGKSRFLNENKRKIVTGIAVHNEFMTLPRTKKKELMNVFYHIKKYGYISHVAKMKIKNPYYIDSLIGRFGFWKQIEPNNTLVIHCLAYLKNIKSNI
ncbi:reverse transcriptase family protein [Leclercia adecarboxylata]|jgi:retron-type reverse transcriptase|uniref:reverse transcriptase family protein n=1 Tax=Leclercia adecarboxylata TaxID=83655 RepID=UPI0013C9ADCC|nr:reverse transcriptase family protein [Leclercia adecarboxylata]NEG93024.1 RNA-directed DNA polymerase [Leclercia adecarboxylata]